MPLYMDIHSIENEGFSAEEVAKAHVKDLAIQDKFGVVQIKYWVNLDDKLIFCLMKGPDKESCQRVHKEAHGGTACNIIEVQDDEIGFYLGTGISIKDLAYTNEGNLDSGYRTLLRFSVLAHAHKANYPAEEINKIIRQFNGSRVAQGDENILVSFVSARDAACCARKIFKHIKELEGSAPLKIAVVTGNPVDIDGNDLFEEAKDQVDKLCTIASGAAIYMDVTTCNILIKHGEGRLAHEEMFKLVDGDSLEFLNQLFALLDNNLYTDRFDPSGLYHQLAISKSQFYRKIKSLTTLPPHYFFQEMRLRKAYSELLQKKKRIAEIGYGLGFNSATYFTRAFRKKFGVLPSELMRQVS